MQRICLIGGGGFIGTAIANRLVQRGCAVTIPARHREHAKQQLIPLPNADVVECNVNDPAQLEKLLQGHDAVVSLVGILHGSEAKFRAAHVELPEKIIAACKKLGIRRLVHISALGADARGSSRYLRSKGEGEDRIKTSGLDWTIFRPSVVFGRGDAFLNMFAKLTALPVLPLAGADSRYQPVWVEDVAQAVDLALQRPEWTGKSFNLVGPKEYSLRQLVAYVASLQKHQPMIVSLPEGIARLQASIMQVLPRPLMSVDNIDSMKTPSVDPAGFPAELGFRPTSVDSVAPEYVGLTGVRGRLLEFRTKAHR